MKKSLLITLISWIGFGYLYYHFFHGQYEPPADLVSALVGGTFMMFGVSCLRSLRLAYIDRRLLKSASTSKFLNNKKVIAITGRIKSFGDPLKTPFSEQEAVLYSYEIYDEKFVTVRDNKSTRTERRTSLMLTGYELTPSAIESSWGTIKLLCYPSLEGFREEHIESAVAIPKAKVFVAKKKYDDMTGMKVMKAISEAKDLFADTDGAVCKHFQFNKDYDLDTLEYKEQIVRQGEEVCAVGCYDPALRGIIPDFSIGNGICRLYKGGVKQALQKVNGRISGLFFAAAFLIVACNAIMYFVLQRYDHAESQLEARASRLRDAITSDKTDEVKEIIKYSINVNKADSSGQTLLMLVRDAETAKLLIEKGANINAKDSNGRTPLMLAAQYGRTDVVEALLKAGADPNVKDNYGDTALNLAFSNNGDEMISVLSKYGAVNNSINESNGSRLDINSAPVKTCFDYISAIQRADTQKMKELCTERVADFFDTIDFSIWQSTRPKNPVLVSAFANDITATVVVDGEPGTLRFEYQLSLVEGGWKIEKERVVE